MWFWVESKQSVCQMSATETSQHTQIDDELEKSEREREREKEREGERELIC